MSSGLVIKKAEYFTAEKSLDVTDAVIALVESGEFNIEASNDLSGDPQYGKKKTLSIQYGFDGEEYEVSVQEGESICLQQFGEFGEAESPKPVEIVIKQQEKPSFVDIIIPTYNNEQLTVDCFKSIKEHTEPGTYRVIWVDNGSESMDRAAAELAGTNHINIFLTENTGFVGAINEGLRVSNAPAVCLLNNDTEVSVRWLEKLVNTLYATPEMGIVGPLTGPPAVKKKYDSHHNIAYQQAAREVPVFPYYRTLEQFNEQIEKELSGVVGKVDFVAFLCAVIKREVIDAVGFLDPNYDFGMWDDLDWNRSAEKAGYSHGLSLDTCIIHKGRSTFNVIQEKEGFDVNALLAKNRKYLDEKWANNVRILS